VTIHSNKIFQGQMRAERAQKELKIDINYFISIFVSDQ
jgi:hypothetical protein